MISEFSNTLQPSGGDFFSISYGGFQTFLGGIQDRWIYIQDSLFCKYQYGGAAKFKVAFFRTSIYNKPVAVIMDFSYQESTYFHLDQKTEMFGVNDRVLSGIFQEDGAGF